MLTSCNNVFTLTALKIALHLAETTDCMHSNELSAGRIMNLRVLKCFDSSIVHYDTSAFIAMGRAVKLCMSRSRWNHRVYKDERQKPQLQKQMLLWSIHILHMLLLSGGGHHNEKACMNTHHVEVQTLNKIISSLHSLVSTLWKRDRNSCTHEDSVLINN